MARSSTISQPTAMRPAFGVEQAPLLQGAQQHHRAGDRKRQAENKPCRNRPAEQQAQAQAQQCHDHDLDQRAGNGDGAYGEQILQRKMQADAEHQQDHADLGQLERKLVVGNEARRIGPDQHAGEQVADKRRHPQPVRNRAEHEGKSEAEDDGGHQGGVFCLIIGE